MLFECEDEIFSKLKKMEPRKCLSTSKPEGNVLLNPSVYFEYCYSKANNCVDKFINEFNCVFKTSMENVNKLVLIYIIDPLSFRFSWIVHFIYLQLSNQEFLLHFNCCGEINTKWIVIKLYECYIRGEFSELYKYGIQFANEFVSFGLAIGCHDFEYLLCCVNAIDLPLYIDDECLLTLVKFVRYGFPVDKLDCCVDRNFQELLKRNCDSLSYLTIYNAHVFYNSCLLHEVQFFLSTRLSNYRYVCLVLFLFWFLIIFNVWRIILYILFILCLKYYRINFNFKLVILNFLFSELDLFFGNVILEVFFQVVHFRLLLKLYCSIFENVGVFLFNVRKVGFLIVDDNSNNSVIFYLLKESWKV